MKTGEVVPCEIEDSKDKIVFTINNPSDEVRKLFTVNSQKLLINGITELALERTFLDLSNSMRVIHALYKDIKYIRVSKEIYTTYMTDLKDHGSTHIFAWFVANLPAKDFMRVHGGHIVNRAHIKEVIKHAKTFTLVMSDGERLTVSHTYYNRFELWY